MTRSYSELMRLETAEERFEYLRLSGKIGESTFGFDRYLNQALYTSYEWKKFRRGIILRDNGCDMALPDREIPKGAILVLHHINPLTEEDLKERSPALFDPENVICVSDRTHRAIHYGDISLITVAPIERRPNDTCPWKNVSKEKAVFDDNSNSFAPFIVFDSSMLKQIGSKELK